MSLIVDTTDIERVFLDDGTEIETIKVDDGTIVWQAWDGGVSIPAFSGGTASTDSKCVTGVGYFGVEPTYYGYTTTYWGDSSQAYSASASSGVITLKNKSRTKITVSGSWNWDHYWTDTEKSYSSSVTLYITDGSTSKLVLSDSSSSRTGSKGFSGTVDVTGMNMDALRFSASTYWWMSFIVEGSGTNYFRGGNHISIGSIVCKR